MGRIRRSEGLDMGYDWMAMSPSLPWSEEVWNNLEWRSSHLDIWRWNREGLCMVE
jgi:hypothetical protein